MPNLHLLCPLSPLSTIHFFFSFFFFHLSCDTRHTRIGVDWERELTGHHVGVNSSTSHGRYLTILSVYFSSKKAPLPILKCFPFIFGSHRDGIYNTLIKYNGKTRIWFGKRHDTESKFRKGEKKKKVRRPCQMKFLAWGIFFNWK